MKRNVLYYGDNLEVLRRHVESESVDLVYLDPPFKSNQDYNVLFEERGGEASTAQIKAFEDTWRWDRDAAASMQSVMEAGGRPAEALEAMWKFLGASDMMAYLSMMAPRLVELRRALKPAGSIYLHCDPTASHYLKILMDGIFMPGNFRNEIVWCYTGPSASKKGFPKKHDVILRYSKTDKFVFNEQDIRIPYKELHTDRGKKAAIWGREGKLQDEAVREQYLKRGKIPEDWWVDIPSGGHISPHERLGYPTQKPVALLERIIKASTHEGGTVLDPFCGCGTTIAAAQKLGRRWMGIDITCLATNLIKKRLWDSLGLKPKKDYEVRGEPATLTEAANLAKEDPYQFQWWVLGLVGARGTEEKKGADKGMDGRRTFFDEFKNGAVAGDPKHIIFSVKAGHATAAHVRDLRGVVEREKAAMGVLLTMEEPTKPMRAEAASAGFYKSPRGKNYPRIQIFTVSELLEGKGLAVPASELADVTFRKAGKVKEAGEEYQKKLVEE